MSIKPEDQSASVKQPDIVRALHEVGVGAGDLVFFHSSLSSMGWVQGGAQTVIDGFLEAVAPEGTVAVPTLCQRDIERRFETWDIRTSPSDVGRITEEFRLRPEAVRSDHATHSVAAIGPRAQDLTRDHASAHDRPSPWGDAAFAADSPWDKLYHWNAAYCFLGVTFRVNTMRHYIQSLLVERELEALPPERRGAFADRLRGWRKPGFWPDWDPLKLMAYIESLGLLRQSRIGLAALLCVRARKLVDEALKALRGRPQEWLRPEFLPWLREVRAAAYSALD